jgi:hypothetical protein
LSVGAALRESLLDLLLLSLGLVFAVYFHHSAAAAGVSGLLRSEVIFLELIGYVAPRFIVVEHALKALSHVRAYREARLRRENSTLSLGDRSYLFGLGLAAFLLLIAPSVMNVPASLIGQVVLWEVIPWNV